MAGTLCNRTKEELKEMHRRLIHENLQTYEITHFINILSEEQYEEAKKDIAKFLEHPDGMIRDSALIALTLVWIESEYKNHCLNLLQKELPEVPSLEEDLFYYEKWKEREDLRDEQETAVLGLGSILKIDKDVKVLKFLINFVEDTSKEWSQRKSAYGGILHFSDVPYSKRKLWFKNDEEIEQYIDWKLVENLKKKYEGVNVEESKKKLDHKEKKEIKRSKKELDEIYRKLMRETLKPSLMAHYIDVLASENYVKAKKDIATFLHHADVDVRRMALVALTLIWIEPEYKTNCLTILRKKVPELPAKSSSRYKKIDQAIRDIHYEQRAALAGLANILWLDKDVNIVKFFIGYIEDKNFDWDDKEVAYNGILNFLDVSYRKRKLAFQDDKEKEEYIDWKLIQELNKKYRIE